MSSTDPASTELPAPEQVRPGLWSIPLPIPIPSLRYVVAYVFESPSGLAIVDPGWDSDLNLSILVDKLAHVGLSLDAVRLIVATHWHADHIGIGGRLRTLTGAKLAMHPLDATRLLTNEERRAANSYGTATLLAAGVPRDDIARLSRPQQSSSHHSTEVDIALEDRALLPLKDWQLRTIWTPGHTAGSICFHDEGSLALLTGDHVLAKISPNISFDPEFDSARDPLAEFVESLRRVATLDTVEVLPAHLWRFNDLRGRVDELVSHHEQRLLELLEAVKSGHHTTWEIAQAVTWSREWSSFSPTQEFFALRETWAHLVHLERQSRISKQPGTPDRWTAPC